MQRDESVKMLTREIAFDEKNYEKGIERIKSGKSFVYRYIRNGQIVSSQDKKRIDKLRLPPAWTSVWISADPKSSIQAVGIDNKNRKQYRYHEKHVERSEQQKFLRMLEFIKAIPKLEKAMGRHENLGPYDKNRVIASMLTIVRELHMRVGKEVYARTNKSYGVSSLRKIHMNIEGDMIKFRFKGKSNKRLSYSLTDKLLARHLRLLLRLEGNRLFQYIDENNKVLPVTDMDLNRYIQTHMGNQFTVKDFRSYAANYYFIKTLLSETRKRTPKNPKAIKKNIINALKSTAYYLRHTKAISKKSYVLSFARSMYERAPEWFIDRKDNDADDVLLDILQLYKKYVLKL